MDKIHIDGLELFAYHGVLEAETALGQKFFVSVELSLDLRPAGMTDDLHETVNYAEVCQTITEIMTQSTYQLIETCAEQIAGGILHTFPQVRAVTVTVEKPWAPIGQSVRNLSVQISRKWSKVYLGLGANMGDPKSALDAAIQSLPCEALNVLQCSTYYTTKPVSDVPQDDYLNCVVEAETTLPPHDLMTYLLEIEASLGRERTVHRGPRTIDIDLLTYDQQITDDPYITLPHPRMHERLFVLVPLCELNPNYIHPLLCRRVSDLKAELEQIQTL